MSSVTDPGYNAAKQARYRERLRAFEDGNGLDSLTRVKLTALAPIGARCPAPLLRRPKIDDHDHQ
jgi:hypothetical protein